jgi:hypothetical protein
MRPRPDVRACLALAALGLAAALGSRVSGQAPAPFAGLLDEHPVIQYGLRPTTDPVARLNAALREGRRTLVHEPAVGYLRTVLAALDVPQESQLLVFSKSGIQRELTSPSNPRALYYSPSVVVGYVAGAPVLELASHDPQQGTVFYTLDQGRADAPQFVRASVCLTCHISVSTLDVPGLLDRSHRVGEDGRVLQRVGPAITVNHQTPHTQRWGGWFVTGGASPPPYQPLGHLGNLTIADVGADGRAAIMSNHALVRWLDSAPESRGYLSAGSDLAALMVFDHQAHAWNLLTRLNWEWRVAAAAGPVRAADAPFRQRIEELADYLLFVDEATPVVEVTPRPGFAERLIAATPRDRDGRSLAELDLTVRLMRYPVSYMIYAAAFDGLPAEVRAAVYERLFTRLSGADRSARYAHLRTPQARAAAEILRDTKTDLPAPYRGRTNPGGGRPQGHHQ